MSIRLTDEEIRGVRSVARECDPTPSMMREEMMTLMVAKAQLKKVVKWGELYCIHDNGGVSIKAWACPICRQALLKEAEE